MADEAPLRRDEDKPGSRSENITGKAAGLYSHDLPAVVPPAFSLIDQFMVATCGLLRSRLTPRGSV